MNFRRAVTSVGVGLAIALGSAAPAHAGTYEWWNAGSPGQIGGQQTRTSNYGYFSAFTGFAQTSSYNVELYYYYYGGGVSGGYTARSNICFSWAQPQNNIGVIVGNPHTFSQYMTSWMDSYPTSC